MRPQKQQKTARFNLHGQSYKVLSFRSYCYLNYDFITEVVEVPIEEHKCLRSGDTIPTVHSQVPRLRTPSQLVKLQAFITILDVCFAIQLSTYFLQTNKIYNTTSLLTDSTQRQQDANRTTIESFKGILPIWQIYENFKMKFRIDYADHFE